MTEQFTSSGPGWRNNHPGYWLRMALEKYDQRVLECMAHHAEMPLGLANLAARGQVGAAHLHITRHLELEGTRLTDLARMAGMTKQAMGSLVDQCEAWGMVQRTPDAADARARRVAFTEVGLAWLSAYRAAVEQAHEEMRQAVGSEIVTVVTLGLEAYCGH
jgi:DNA-binding MarR family transcriptional regulator